MDNLRTTARNVDALLASVKEIEDLLRLPPGVPGRTDKVCALLNGIARLAPHGGIADLARKLSSEVRDVDSRRTNTYLGHLKASLREARKSATGANESAP